LHGAKEEKRTFSTAKGKSSRRQERKQNKYRGGPPGQWGWSTEPMRRGLGSWAGSPWRRDSFGAVSVAQGLQGDTETEVTLAFSTAPFRRETEITALFGGLLLRRCPSCWCHSAKEMEAETSPSEEGLAGVRRWRWPFLPYRISSLCEVTALLPPGHFASPC